jgi:hypothetical protein
MGYDPENYSQAQLDELDSLTERWVADHLQKAKASKKHKRTRHSCEESTILKRHRDVISVTPYTSAAD